jgi:hypothetical protein
LWSTAPGPRATPEFQRIVSLPRRRWQEDDTLEASRSELTKILKTPDGKWELLPTQAAALLETYNTRGLFGPIAVGAGKTLITLLAPVICDAKRPVLLVPAQLRNQTIAHVLPEMQKHWRLHPDLLIVGYEELGTMKNATLLEDRAPDMIVADEVHFLKNLKSGRTKRVSRYMNRAPDTLFVAVSGTVVNHSIMDYWHLLQWALKPDNAPIPGDWHDAGLWAAALDHKVRPDQRRDLGVLSIFCNGFSDRRSARIGYKNRLTETPGVLATAEVELDVRLVVRKHPYVGSKKITDAICKTRKLWEKPNGDVLMQASELWLVERTLSAGFFYSWETPPPKSWLSARKEWGAYVRHRLGHNRKNLDTPAQVQAEAEQDNCREWIAWKEIAPTFEPVKVAEWIDDSVMEVCTEWLEKNGGIVWSEHVEFGERLSERSGFPYFGAGDDGILDFNGGSCIASIESHGVGKNLQQYDRALVVSPHPGALTWEQMLGRMHRQGQKSTEVIVDVLLHTEPLRRAMTEALADSEYHRESLGQSRRLLYCERKGIE